MKKQTEQALSKMNFYQVCETAIEEGSKAAWDYLCLVVWRRAKRVALGMASRFGLPLDDAHDAAQSTMELFMKKGRALIKKSKANGMTGAWLYKFVRDGVTYYMRKAKRQMGNIGEPEPDFFDSTQCDAMESAVTARNLRDAMVKSEEERRIADALSAGMTYRQIASVFGISVNAVHLTVQTMRGRAVRYIDNRWADMEIAA